MKPNLFSRKTFQTVSAGVARWYVFKPKIPIWVNYGGPQSGKCFYILWPFGIFYGELGFGTF
jgi:hypothetical protein